MKTSLNAFKKGSNYMLTGARKTKSDVSIAFENRHFRSYYTSARLKGGRPYSSEASTAVASHGQDGADICLNGLRGPPALNGLAQQKIVDRVSNV